MRLIWLSKMVFGSTTWPVVALSQAAKRSLAACLAWRKRLRKAASSASGSSRRSWLRSVTQPSPIDFGDQLGQVRIGQQQPAARRHAVGLVVESLGKQLREVGDDARAKQVGMDLGHAVGAVRADDGQVGHAHLAGRSLFDEAHPLHAVFVAGIALFGRRRETGG